MVWRELIRRARLSGPVWVVAAVGMAIPALTATVGHLRPGYTGDPDDLDAEVLTGFLTALRDRVDLGAPAPHAGLVWAAWRAGHTLRTRQSEYVTVDDVEHVTGPRTPTIPYGHADLLVRRAVRLGLVDQDDEDAWIDSRLGRRAIEPIAARMGLSDDALRRRLTRIDTRLAAALAQGLLTGAPSPQAAREIADQARHRAATRAGRATNTRTAHITPAA